VWVGQVGSTPWACAPLLAPFAANIAALSCEDGQGEQYDPLAFPLSPLGNLAKGRPHLCLSHSPWDGANTYYPATGAPYRRAPHTATPRTPALLPWGVTPCLTMRMVYSRRWVAPMHSTALSDIDGGRVASALGGL